MDRGQVRQLVPRLMAFIFAIVALYICPPLILLALTVLCAWLALQLKEHWNE